ncbi:DUF3626 domain-containing protein [Myxococcus sp. CA039A]|uniref:DUF3626 domain-containing protein n=1 Tax=Myxococcus sp. CA039A TaxID=2741737 RepID=UPI00157A90CF|nr:DUF3626 domain-containing protein [Myxococcus sp. CA039A]NTX55727.1 DUF3626 domain-containing protein [Myxococcus sp. CA039A]
MAHEWILYIDSDATVLRATRNLLSRYDLFQLREDTGWMTDTLIDHGVTGYDDGLGALNAHQVMWISPSVVKAGKDGDDEAFGNSLGAELGAARHLDLATTQLPKDAPVLLFPVNTEETHWSLLVFSAATRAFVHYDSLGESNAGAARALIQKLHAKGYLSRALDFTTSADVERQEDGYNCGLYVIQFARALMRAGQTLSANPLGLITSASCDLLRGQMLRALEPLFPPAPLAQPPPPLGGESSARKERKPPEPTKKSDSDVILKKSLMSTKSSRKKKLKTALLLATNNDRDFTKCFIHTSPSALTVINGERAESLMTLVDEGRTLWEVLGESSSVPSPRKPKGGGFVSKYSTYVEKGGFTLEPRLHPDTSEAIQTDRTQSLLKRVPAEGFQPTFFQFQRQDMNTLLAHYEQNVPDFHHNHQHIARSLILGMAMANFYLRHGQPRFLPGDTRPESLRTKPANDDGQRDEALARMPEPELDEVDISAIAYGIGMHDCARASSGKDVWEHESARNCFYYLRESGYGNEYAAYVARMIVKNEQNDDERKEKPKPPEEKGVSVAKVLTVSKVDSRSAKKGDAKNTARTDEPKPPRLGDLNEQIVHDADTLEIHRVLNNKKFLPERLLFLTDERLDRVKLAEGRKQEFREQLIADAAWFVHITEKIAVPPEDGDDGKPGGPGRVHFEEGLKSFRGVTKQFCGYFEAHESVLIEAIVQKPRSFPFFYQYYFHACFDPKDAQFLKLTPEERLVLVRARINTIERVTRDHALATEALTAFNATGSTDYTVENFGRDLVQFQLTANLNCDDLEKVIDAVDRGTKLPAHLAQYWEIFFKTGKQRVGASTDSVPRDNAERFKVQYQTPCESPGFDRARRPKYAAINLAQTTSGACPKYGDAAYILKPHLWRRITLTHNDTFSVGVFPDDLCTPTHPFTLLKQISGLRFQEDHLKLYAAGRGQNDGLRRAAQKKAAIPYIEAHIHGLVEWAHDVEEIRISVNPASRDAYKSEEKVWDWGAFDAKLLAFAQLWATDERPGGIPVRYVSDESFEVFATRDDAMKQQNPLGARTVTGKLSGAQHHKAPPKPKLPVSDSKPPDSKPPDSKLPSSEAESTL